MIKLMIVEDPKFPGVELTAPVFLCDGCGVQIRRGSEGVYAWGTKGTDISHFKTFHHSGPDHNDRCRIAWRQWESILNNTGYLSQWMMLTDFVAYLTLNLELPVSDKLKTTDQSWAL